MRNYSSIGVQIPQILLPKAGIDLMKWAVVACDQFTSQPEYWQQVADRVGDAPSTFHLVLPEVFLGKAEETERLSSIQRSMRQYLEAGSFTSYEGLLLVERTAAGRTRHGLMLALDLEQYDYHKGSQTLFRATEGTILDRLPPRIKIRLGAPLELPHILVCIDDPEQTVIEPLFARVDQMQKVYDTDLMLGSGHLSGYFSSDAGLERQVATALERLANPAVFQKKYGVGADHGPLLFAMGDGNHSFATAKAIWEQIKATVGPDHPARYALVEIENVHDNGLVFEPIHRVLFGVRQNFLAAMRQHWGDGLSFSPSASSHEMIAQVNQAQSEGHSFGVITTTGCGVVTVQNGSSNLPVGTVQAFLDAWGQAGGYERIDYVHGEEVIISLGSRPGQLGLYLPAMPKSDLFKTVILDGALPRKTFSMGEAIEKRFYMESRRITE
jgi:hypothetical protein